MEVKIKINKAAIFAANNFKYKIIEHVILIFLNYLYKTWCNLKKKRYGTSSRLTRFGEIEKKN